MKQKNNSLTLILLGNILIFMLSSCASFRKPHKDAVINYEPETSKLLMDFSMFAYIKSYDELERTLKNEYPSYSLLRKIREDENDYDTQGFVAFSKDKVIVSIRGSSSAQDWKNNFKLFAYTNSSLKKHCPKAGVHGGFLESARQLREAEIDDVDKLKVQDAILKLQKEGRKVYFTGHSLGGAIANVLALYAVYETEIEVSGIYTFGEPKSGNSAYRRCHDDKLHDRTFRFINNRDIVARSPPSRTYKHVGNLIYFDTTGGIHDINTYTSFFGIIKDLYNKEFIFDHFQVNYLKLINRHQKTNPFKEEKD